MKGEECGSSPLLGAVVNRARNSGTCARWRLVCRRRFRWDDSRGRQLRFVSGRRSQARMATPKFPQSTITASTRFVGLRSRRIPHRGRVAYTRAGSMTSRRHLPPGLPTLRPVGAAITPTQPGRAAAPALSFMINGLLDFGDDDGVQGFVAAVSAMRGSTTTMSALSRTTGRVGRFDSRFAWQVVAVPPGDHRQYRRDGPLPILQRGYTSDRGLPRFESESRFRPTAARRHHLQFRRPRAGRDADLLDGSVIPVTETSRRFRCRSPPPRVEMPTCWTPSIR